MVTAATEYLNLLLTRRLKRINPILAKLAAADAAYATIKKFVVNGREITEILSPVKNLVTLEEKLRARGNRKKNGLFSKLMGKVANDVDEFLALEQMAENREELESIC